MKQKTLKVKGMWIPSIFIWILGFVHGRILKTAEQDPVTGVVYSGYITSKCKLFNELSAKRIKQLEHETKAVRFEMVELMTKEAHNTRNLEEDIPDSAPVSINEKRSVNHCEARRTSYIKNHEMNIKRLVEIDSKIRSCELNAKAELDAAASILQSRFATYAHGMLLRPIRSDFITPIAYDYPFELYHETHKEEEKKLQSTLKEVFEHE